MASHTLQGADFRQPNGSHSFLVTFLFWHQNDFFHRAIPWLNAQFLQSALPAISAL
jgi:hypothetical protein